MRTKLFSTLALAATLLALSACGKNQQSQIVSGETTSIVNGRPVLATEAYAKHTVGVAPLDNGPCTGVVIGAHHILSAGHCADYFAGGHVLFGLVAQPAVAQVRKIKKISLHPQYCDLCLYRLTLQNSNDLAIVEFEGELPEGFEPVEFAKKEQITVGAITHLAGYGADERYRFDEVLKVTDTVPVDLIGESEIRTSELKSGSCNGDSGGPAFILDNGKLLLAGITSRGDQMCRQLGIYTIPAAHQEWISGVLAAANSALQ